MITHFFFYLSLLISSTKHSIHKCVLKKLSIWWSFYEPHLSLKTRSVPIDKILDKFASYCRTNFQTHAFRLGDKVCELLV